MRPDPGTGSSPANTTSSSSQSTSVGEMTGFDDDAAAATPASVVTASNTPPTSSDSFPSLHDIKAALPAETVDEAQSSSVHPADAHASQGSPSRESSQRVVQDHLLENVSSQAWPPPQHAPSALGMTLGGLPLVPPNETGSYQPQAGDGARRTGSCKFFNAQKGFGFILDDRAAELGNDEVFVHYTAIAAVQGGPRGFRSLLEGEPVEYTIMQGPKGWQAQDVTGPGGAPCVGSPPGGVPKAAFAPIAAPGPPYPRGGMRRAPDGSTGFTSPRRSTRESSLYGSNVADETPRPSISSPASRVVPLQNNGLPAPLHQHSLPSSPQGYQHPIPYPAFGSPAQHHPPPLPFHYPHYAHEEGQSPVGMQFYGTPEDGSPMDPRYASLHGGPFVPMSPPGMDFSIAPPFYPISASTPPGPSLAQPHSYAGPASPISIGAYPISGSPAAGPYPHLYPVPGPYPTYTGFMPTMPPAPPPPQPGLYYGPSGTTVPGFGPQPYPITSSGAGGGAPTQGEASASDEADAPTLPAAAVDGAPSGLAAGWAEGEEPPSYEAEEAQTKPTTTATVKIPAPLPGAARIATKSA